MKVFFRNIHLYLSLAAGIIIFCSCLSGTLLVFEEEIEHTLHHNRYYVEPQGQRLSLAQLAQTAVSQVPKAKLAGIKVYNAADRSVEIGLLTPGKPGEKGEGKSESTGGKSRNGEKAERKSEKGEGKGESGGGKRKNGERAERKGGKAGQKDGAEAKGKGGGKPSLTVYVNPYTGKVIEVFNRRKSFLMQAEMFHRFLLAGKDSLGNKLVGISTLFFLFILITGVVLWWPKTKKIMSQRLVIKWSGGWKRLTHDLHIVTGFYTSIFLIVIVVTGLIMSYKWANGLLFSVSGSKPVTEQPKAPESQIQPGVKPLTADEVFKAINQAVANAEFYNIRTPRDSAAAYSVTLLQEGKLENMADTYFIDQYSGKVAGIHKYTDKNAGQRARSFVKPIHTGSVYGLPTKIISFIVCLLSLIFPVTGVMMWLNRIKKGKRKRIVTHRRPVAAV
jgi:uncharacterized iron-regulated membrane protein